MPLGCILVGHHICRWPLDSGPWWSDFHGWQCVLCCCLDGQFHSTGSIPDNGRTSSVANSFWEHMGQPGEGSGVIIVGQIDIVHAAFICPIRILSLTGIGSLVLPTALWIVIAIIIIAIFGLIIVSKHDLLFHIFWPLAIKYLHRQPDKMLSTPKQNHVIDRFPSCCLGVVYGYCNMSRAMLWQCIQGLDHVYVEPFSHFCCGDDWECPGVDPHFVDELSVGLQQSFINSEDGFSHSRWLAIQTASSKRPVALYSGQVYSSTC